MNPQKRMSAPTVYRILELTYDSFVVANRNVGTGLVGSAVISSWTFPSALLGSTYMTYMYGVSLPVWWANGSSVMLCVSLKEFKLVNALLIKKSNEVFRIYGDQRKA